MDSLTEILNSQPLAWEITLQRHGDFHHIASHNELDLGKALKIFVTMGHTSCTVQLNDEDVEVKRGDILAFTGFENFTINTDDTNFLMVISAAEGCQSDVFESLPVQHLMELGTINAAPDPSYPLSQLLCMQCVKDHQIPGQMGISEGLVRSMLSFVVSDMVARQKISVGIIAGLNDPQLAPAIGQMHQSLGRDWGLVSLSALSGLSRTSFAQRFKEVVGEPPLTHLTRMRMAKSMTLLRQTPMSVDEVAKQCGYSSESAFYKAFKKIYGHSPRVAAKHLNKGNIKS